MRVNFCCVSTHISACIKFSITCTLISPPTSKWQQCCDKFLVVGVSTRIDGKHRWYFHTTTMREILMKVSLAIDHHHHHHHWYRHRYWIPPRVFGLCQGLDCSKYRVSENYHHHIVTVALSRHVYPRLLTDQVKSRPFTPSQLTANGRSATASHWTVSHRKVSIKPTMRPTNHTTINCVCELPVTIRL